MSSIGVIIRIDTNSNVGFQNWNPKLELNRLFIYLVDTTRIRAELIDIDTDSDKDT